MNRAVHATTPSGDEVTLRANAQLAARPRTVAQVEHNAMQALDLVRATLTALNEVTRSLDRAALLLSHHGGGPVDTAVRPELRRVIEQIGVSINTAQRHGDLLLQGGAAAFALQAAGDEASEPLQVELPNLADTFRPLAAIDLGSQLGAGRLAEHRAALAGEVHAAQRRLAAQAKGLGDVLSEQRRAPRPAVAARRAEDEGFVAMIQQVRNSVLHAGGAALLVQGSPSARAAWLVEALDVAP